MALFVLVYQKTFFKNLYLISMDLVSKFLAISTTWYYSFTLWLLFVNYPILLVAQPTDTTQNIVSTTENLSVDSILNMLHKAQTEYDNQNFGGALQYVQGANSLADEFGFEDGKIESLLLMARLYKDNNEIDFSLKYYLQALQLQEKLKSKPKLFEIYLELGAFYEDIAVHERALEYFIKAYKITVDEYLPSSRPKALLHIAHAYEKLAYYDLALSNYSEALNIYEQAEDYDNILHASQQISKIYTTTAHYDKALATNFEILKFHSLLNDSISTVITLDDIGSLYREIGNYKESLKYFMQSLTMRQQLHNLESTPVGTYINIGLSYQNLKDYKKSLRYFTKALQQVKGTNNNKQLANAYNLIANVYIKKRDFYNAHVYNKKAIDVAKKHRIFEILVASYATKSQILKKQKKHKKALAYYQLYVETKDTLFWQQKRQHEQQLQQQYTLEKVEKELKLLLVDREIKELEWKKTQLEAEKEKQAYDLLLRDKELQEIQLSQEELEKTKALQAAKLLQQALNTEKKDRQIKTLEKDKKINYLALREQTLEHQERKRTIALLEREKQVADLVIKQKELKEQEKERTIALLEQDKKLQTLALERSESRKKYLMVISIIVLNALLILLAAFHFLKKTNKKLARQQNELAFEKEKSDKLLLNILPKVIADELKEKSFATPRSYEMVTVLFADFKGFTKIAEQVAPEKLLQDLDECFMAFDEIVAKYNLEKIKTIGDGYMCAGGIPIPNNSNPLDAIKAAMGMQAFMKNWQQKKRKKKEPFWELRLGIHTGKVVAGVVGKRKFVYDIWGDAVNTAARMESCGEAGKINISGATYELIKDDFSCNYRGRINAKNKGEIDMYFLQSEVPAAMTT